MQPEVVLYGEAASACAHDMMDRNTVHMRQHTQTVSQQERRCAHATGATGQAPLQRDHPCGPSRLRATMATRQSFVSRAHSVCTEVGAMKLLVMKLLVLDDYDNSMREKGWQCFKRGTQRRVIFAARTCARAAAKALSADEHCAFEN